MFSQSGPTVTGTSKSSFISEAIFDRNLPVEANDAASETTFASFSTSASIVQGRPRVPPVPPAAAGGRPFPCPVCGRTVININSRQSWKYDNFFKAMTLANARRKHVFQDIQPYTCFLPECERDVTMFSSLRSWEQHVKQHGARLQLLSCPFCPHPKGADWKHIGRHLREIALAVIPPGDDSEPDSSDTSQPTIGSNESISVSSGKQKYGHWAEIVFGQTRPHTMFGTQAPLPVSACFGAASEPTVEYMHKEGYRAIMELPFANGDLFVILCVMPHDSQARICCSDIRIAEDPKESCVPLKTLRVQRQDSCLEFHYVDTDGNRAGLYLRLQFLSYEKLILLYCTFLSLKASDRGYLGTVDHRIHGEELLFGGKIVDDGYEHALWLLQDQDTGVVRLEASIPTGEMKR